MSFYTVSTKYIDEVMTPVEQPKTKPTPKKSSGCCCWAWCSSSKAVKKIEPELATFTEIGTPNLTPMPSPQISVRKISDVRDTILPMVLDKSREEILKGVKAICTTALNKDDFRKNRTSKWLGECMSEDVSYNLEDTIAHVYYFMLQLPQNDEALKASDINGVIEKIKKLQTCVRRNENISRANAAKIIMRSNNYINTIRERFHAILADQKLTDNINRIPNAVVVLAT